MKHKVFVVFAVALLVVSMVGTTMAVLDSESESTDGISGIPGLGMAYACPEEDPQCDGKPPP